MLKKILLSIVAIVAILFAVVYFLSRPNQEADGSYSPSNLALKLGTVAKQIMKRLHMKNIKEPNPKS